MGLTSMAFYPGIGSKKRCVDYIIKRSRKEKNKELKETRSKSVSIFE